MNRLTADEKLDRQLDAKEKRRLAADDRAIERAERKERKAATPDPLFGTTPFRNAPSASFKWGVIEFPNGMPQVAGWVKTRKQAEGFAQLSPCHIVAVARLQYIGTDWASFSKRVG